MPLYNLMEDAATAEICRAQLWQWLHFEAPLDDACPERSRGGRRFTRELFDALFEEEVGVLLEVPCIADAADIFHEIVVSEEFKELLTLPSHELMD